MNPSTNDILTAIQQVHAKDVFVFPNNKNIILAARQAAEMVTDKTVHVVPTTTVPQGISAMVAYLPMLSAQENLESMEMAIGQVKTGQLTYAVRDSSVNGKAIQTGDILCMLDNEIVLTGTDMAQAAQALLDMMLEDCTEGSIVGIYYGQGVEEAHAQALCQYVEAKYPGLDLECRSGGQPLYDYIFSVE